MSALIYENWTSLYITYYSLCVAATRLNVVYLLGVLGVIGQKQWEPSTDLKVDLKKKEIFWYDWQLLSANASNCSS